MVDHTVWQYEYQAEYNRWNTSLYCFESSEDAEKDARKRLVPGMRWRLVKIEYFKPMLMGE